MARWRYAHQRRRHRRSARGPAVLVRVRRPVDLRFLLVFRFVRFLKLTRYSPAMRSLLDALYRERRALFGCVVILIGDHHVRRHR